MGNMAYARFTNTLKDLQDCYENMEDNLVEEEEESRLKLISLCKKIVKNYDEVETT